MAKKRGFSGTNIFVIAFMTFWCVGFFGGIGWMLSQVFSGSGGYSHDGNDYCDIKAVNYNAVLKENGDMEVAENLTFRIKTSLSTPYHEMYREFFVSPEDIAENIAFDMDSFSVTEHREGLPDIQYDYKPYYGNSENDPERGSLRKDGTFSLKYILHNSGKGDLFELQWYITEVSGVYNYTIRYTYKNVLDVYEDAAQLNILLFSGGALKYVDSYKAAITFPAGLTSSDKFKVFPHNQKNAQVSIDGDIVNYSIENPRYNIGKNAVGFVELRAVMGDNAVSVFSAAQKRKTQVSYADIIAEETRWAEEYARNKVVKAVLTAADFILAAAAVCGSVFFVYFLKKKYYTAPAVDYKYFREIPNDLEAAAALELVAKRRNVRDGAMSATILSLCRKDALAVREEIRRNGGRETCFYINPDFKGKLAPCEKRMLDFFKAVSKGWGAPVTFKDIRRHVELSGKLDFPKEFQTIALEELMKNGYIKERPGILKIISRTFGFLGVLAGLAVFIMGIIFLETYTVIPFAAGAALAVCSLITAIRVKNISLLTQAGADSFAQWNGLYNFLNDLTIIDEAELPQADRWEEYLIYAAAFGVSKKVVNALQLRFPQEFEQGRDMFSHFGGSLAAAGAIAHSVSSSASSFSRPSSSGDGGSGGGGSSGGGGGGHGGGGGGGRH